MNEPSGLPGGERYEGSDDDVTWKDLKVIVLQKVFAITDGNPINDDTTREYLTALPGAANEGLELMATAGRFLKKEFAVVQSGGHGDGSSFQEGQQEPSQCPTVVRVLSGQPVERYDLEAQAPDFYALDSDGVYYEGGGAYRRAADWSMEAGHVLVLPGDRTGRWRLWYNAYPAELTQDTADGYELPLPPEVAALLPLYVASQVYKDDDIAQAVQYRNEFEVGRDALLRAGMNRSMGRDDWTSVTGWW